MKLRICKTSSFTVPPLCLSPKAFLDIDNEFRHGIIHNTFNPEYLTDKTECESRGKLLSLLLKEVHGQHMSLQSFYEKRDANISATISVFS